MTRQTANSLASVLGTCFLLCLGLQILSLGLYLGLHDWAYSIHSQLFNLTPEAFDREVYHFMGQLKILGLVLFLIPWASLKLIARRLPE